MAVDGYTLRSILDHSGLAQVPAVQQGVDMLDLQARAEDAVAKLDDRIQLQSLRKLVFGGGALRGWAYVGLRAGFDCRMRERGAPDVTLRSLATHLYGTSIGALFALCLAADAGGEDFHATAAVLGDMRASVVRFLSTRALYDFKPVEAAVDLMLRRRGFSHRTTMAEFEHRTGKRVGFVHVDSTGPRAVYTTSDIAGTPDHTVLQCVLDSMRMPIAFEARVSDDGLAQIIDGGVLENVPLTHCDDETDESVLVFEFEQTNQSVTDAKAAEGRGVLTKGARALRNMVTSVFTTVQHPPVDPAAHKKVNRRVTMNLDFLSTRDMCPPPWQVQSAIVLGFLTGCRVADRIQLLTPDDHSHHGPAIRGQLHMVATIHRLPRPGTSGIIRVPLTDILALHPKALLSRIQLVDAPYARLDVVGVARSDVLRRVDNTTLVCNLVVSIKCRDCVQVTITGTVKPADLPLKLRITCEPR